MNLSNSEKAMIKIIEAMYISGAFALWCLVSYLAIRFI